MLTRGETVVDACTALQSKRGNVLLWKRSTSKHLLEQWQRRRFMKWKHILPLSSWVQTSFNLGGHFFLGGKSTECFEEFFKIWWTGYKKMDPNLPFFNDFGEKFVRASLPIALHGDEGHGRYKRPIMIFSYQPLITSFDGRVNLKGSGCVQQSVWISIHLNYILSCLYPKIFWVEICMFPHSFQEHVNFLMFPQNPWEDNLLQPTIVCSSATFYVRQKGQINWCFSDCFGSGL